MLDEPTEGVQPENIEPIAAVVNRRKADGTSFIIVEQNLSSLLQSPIRYSFSTNREGRDRARPPVDLLRSGENTDHAFRGSPTAEQALRGSANGQMIEETDDDHTAPLPQRQIFSPPVDA